LPQHQTGGLDHHVKDWQPAPTTSIDTLNASTAGTLAATLDLDSAPADGDPLPPLWHWVYFAEWPPTCELGVDGHPRNGHLLPPIPDRRRMFAGGRLEIHSPLVLGESASRRTEVVSTAVKHGRTGELLFVTVRSTYTQNGQPRLTEEQDLVYRSDSGSTTSFARVDEPLAPTSAPWTFEPATHPALLFRFSAITSNAHRIHYDAQYTMNVEGFPDLVVHGPLLVMYMAELARTHSARPLRSFHYRLVKPVFVGDAIRVEGTPADDDTGAELAVVSGTGTVHASARAVFA
jgi:3-methylfumaryl-CoA hydratase